MHGTAGLLCNSCLGIRVTGLAVANSRPNAVIMMMNRLQASINILESFPSVIISVIE